MDNNVTIRRAERKDCKRILELVKELAEFEKAPHEVSVSLEHFTESGFGEKPVWWAFVAEVEETVIGMALCYIRFSTWKGQTVYLEDIIVTENMRGKNIGSLLFENVLKYSADQGFKRVSWQVLEWNEPAIAFYKKYKASFDGEWVNCSVSVS